MAAQLATAGSQVINTLPISWISPFSLKLARDGNACPKLEAANASENSSIVAATSHLGANGIEHDNGFEGVLTPSKWLCGM